MRRERVPEVSVDPPVRVLTELERKELLMRYFPKNGSNARLPEPQLGAPRNEVSAKEKKRAGERRLGERYAEALSINDGKRRRGFCVTGQGTARGIRHGMAVLDDARVLRIREMAEKGWPLSDIARTERIGHSTVLNVVKGYTWKHVGGWIKPKSERPTLPERILAFLQTSQRSRRSSEIAAACGSSPALVRATACKMCNRGRLIRASRGLFRAPES